MATGNLVLTGLNVDTGHPIDVTKLTIKGQAGAWFIYPLTGATVNPTPSSATSATGGGRV
ncbi:MAG TPA: hypothetical protein VGK74_00645 [Symbiobacteriaceae bacterium]|jgi:hypothetical protein